MGNIAPIIVHHGEATMIDLHLNFLMLPEDLENMQPVELLTTDVRNSGVAAPDTADTEEQGAQAAQEEAIAEKPALQDEIVQFSVDEPANI